MIELTEGLCFLVAYFLPTLVAILQNKKIYNIFTINLFLGWTIFGWVVALAMALSDKNKKK